MSNRTMNRTPRIGRRALLAGSGGFGLAALSGLSAPRAQPPIPRRVVFVYNGDGLLLGSWEPRPLAGRSATTATDWQLGPILAPLADYRDQMIFFENLDMVSIRSDPTPASNAHSAGATHAMTAAFRRSGNSPGGISIEQFIARELNKNGPLTPLPSLEVACTAHHVEGEAFTKGNGERVPVLIRPTEVYQRLFPNPPNAALVKAEQDRRLQAFLQEEFRTAEARVVSGDRDKLQRHGRAVNDLWQRVTLSGTRDAYRPPASIVDPARTLNWNYNAPRETAWAERFEVASSLNMRLVAAAFHTDTTRVALVDLVAPPESLWGYRNGDFGSTDAHDLTHKVHDSRAAQSSNAQARDAIFREGRLKVEKIKILVDELARLREPDGSRLLDHTLVVVVSQIANGSHATDRLSWFTIGGLGGHFRTGQLIKFARSPHGRPHNDLYVSVANAMGIPITTFGAASVATGPIRQMNG